MAVSPEETPKTGKKKMIKKTKTEKKRKLSITNETGEDRGEGPKREKLDEASVTPPPTSTNDKGEALEAANGDESSSNTQASGGRSDDGKTGRQYTVSIALPGSIISNAQTKLLKSYLCGQIARAAAVFNIDEIIVFKEEENPKLLAKQDMDPNFFLAHNLQYLETPQYLRKDFFPRHESLEFAGVMNPVDAPHHLRATETAKYREGVVLDKPVKKGHGSFVNIGLRKECMIDKHLKPGVRVTVEVKEEKKKHFVGRAVSPSAPREVDGLYWGYSTRIAPSLRAALSSCPYEGGYDLLIGTSERGEDVASVSIRPFKHMLIVFGGLGGLEVSLDEEDPAKIAPLFDHYVNTCPSQGSRTIRTEEAILITMSALRTEINRSGLH